ncbi:ABC transporter ATP-binding protein [Adhaeribacter pallidiroseus]|uniref:Spermidine/putrescine import ATP-binding protein PotA n=1 Tax=Adhaeribacter pallidiroseus TaxID=2072847 RepID=A0A369QKP4_9BACT|nr:ABC transporter ATP-binding protein [Adhaeribacter pallidiroseus]RDC63827.1 Spermidine/putrescine import ATP-binding protein PotA [Adhaeribacter pallidiroseus]
MPTKATPTLANFLQVSRIYLREAGNQVLQDISFTQPEFSKLAIAGETGSGKSTLLQTIAGLVQPSSGEVRLDQKRVKGPQEHLIPGHPGIVYLSQQFELPPFLRVEQILQYANKLEPATAENLYEVCRISHLLSRRTDHLSGGERQRIALARLVLSSPRLLLLDEPFSNLDSIHKNILKTVIEDVRALLGITCILISHDPLDTLPWADEIIVMQAGKIIQQGTPTQIYHQPVNAYAAGLFGNYNLIPAARAKSFSHMMGTPLYLKKSLLTRPENLKITPALAPELPGKVEQVSFFGAYYEIEVRLSKIKLKVRTENGNYKKGDLVSITIPPEAVWYLES